jgi:hypothetical protein
MHDDVEEAADDGAEDAAQRDGGRYGCPLVTS